MNKTEIEDRIKILKEEIDTRKKEVSELSEKLMDMGSFRDKFVIWYNNSEAETLGSLAGGSVRSWCDNHLDLGSMRGVVYLCEYEEFEMYANPGFEDYISKEEGKKEIERLESDEIFMAACEQMMKENFDSFEIDW